AAEEAAEARLRSLVARLDARWGAHRRVSMRVPLLRPDAPLPELLRALAALDCYGDLTVWGPVPVPPPAGPRWAAASRNQSDADAPMILVGVVSDRPVTEPEERDCPPAPTSRPTSCQPLRARPEAAPRPHAPPPAAPTAPWPPPPPPVRAGPAAGAAPADRAAWCARRRRAASGLDRRRRWACASGRCARSRRGTAASRRPPRPAPAGPACAPGRST